MTRVLLFAQAREAAGTRQVDLDGATVAEVLAVAAERFGAEFARVVQVCTIVVDDTIVPRSEHGTHTSGAELAVLPPVSGGATEDGLHAHGHDHGHRESSEGSGAALRVGVLTVSDRASAGTYEDLTGPAIEVIVGDRLDAQVVERAVVPDDAEVIGAALRSWCDGGGVDLVLTNGGTGLSPRDVTPEATRAVLEVEAPGIGELMRAAGLAHTPLAALARQTAGRRGGTIVVNLPGSVKGATESLEAVVGVLAHACATAGGGRG